MESIYKKQDNVGKVFSTNNFGNLLVTEYIDTNNVKVMFLDTKYERYVSMKELRNGKVKDRLRPSVYDIGIVGEESTSDSNGKILKEYSMWHSMMNRCYNKKFHQRSPTYVSCTVSEDFKYYPYFRGWVKKQIGFGNSGWQLDKDILAKGNKVYSEDHCVIVPTQLNNLLIKKDADRGDCPLGVFFNVISGKYVASLSNNGCKRLGAYDTSEEAFYAYKQAKEDYIKVVANEWKDQIDKRVYDALMDYTIEITD